MAKGTDDRRLAALDVEFGRSKEMLTSAEIAMAYKAALSDFVRGETTSSAIKEVRGLLDGALASRRQHLAEERESNKQIRDRY